MAVKNIVFDIGNVLLKWEPAGIYQTLFNRNDFSNHPLSEIVGGDIWLKMDQGLLSLNEGIEKSIVGNEHYKDDIKKFFLEAPYHFFPVEDTVNAAKHYQERGYKIFLLSNFHEYGYGVLCKRFPFFKDFDGGVISWEVKLNKPDRRIYKVLLSKYNLDPGETIFIDDMKENIDAAENLGIKGIHFCSTTNLSLNLENLVK